jgi:hypothetical protein
MATKPAAKKVDIREVLAATDLNSKEAWDEFSTEEQKAVSLFVLNRYLSSVVSKDREVVEHYLLATNEMYNKNLYAIMSKHPKLTWQLACSCSYDNETIQNHKWIKVEKTSTKKEKFLADLFPEMKMDDIIALANITTDKEVREYCVDLGWDRKKASAIKF